jgi:hypothetical protein
VAQVTLDTAQKPIKTNKHMTQTSQKTTSISFILPMAVIKERKCQYKTEKNALPFEN